VTITLPERQHVDLDGPVSFLEWDGPSTTTFVLVHGLGGSSLNWSQVGPGLSGLGRVLALDLPGFGRSPRAGRGSGLMDQRRALSRFIEQQATGTVILGGNSMGGATAMLHAAVEPDSVGGLVLTGSVYPWARGGWPHPLVITGFAAYDIPAVGDRVVEARLRHLSAARLVRMSYRMCTADPSTIPPEVTEASVALVEERAKDPDVGPAFLDAWRSMRRLGKRPDIAKRAMDAIACPVLVMHGRRDRLVPVAFAEAALRAHPAWRGRIFPDLGHLPQMEAPGRWLAEVADWYAESLD
jgi:pimeloyl-ACP methyl ester carboxylesterase